MGFVRSLAAGPSEGWGILLLHVGIIATAAWVVGRSEWVEVPAELAIAAAVGGMIGFFLAKTSCPDVIAHLTATLIGLWVVTLSVISVFPELGVGRRERFGTLLDRARDWYRTTTSGDQRDDQILFVFVLVLTLWLVAYLSAWTLFRRRWLLVSVLLPAFLVVILLGYSPELGAWPIVFLLTLSGVLCARYFAFRRQQVWTRFRIPAPHALSRRFLTLGTVLVVGTMAAAWTLPVSTESDAFQRLQDEAAGPAGAVADWWLNAVPDLSRQSGSVPESYASFGDSFELGGRLDLSDDPAATLNGVEGPQYLVGLRYDEYTGRGWESDVRSTFDPVGPDGVTYSPQLTFRPEQEVALSDPIRSETVEVDGIVTTLRPRGDLLLTLDTYLRSDVATSVQLSWRRLDDVAFNLRSGDREALPTDLRPLASLLLSVEGFDSDETVGGSPVPTDPDLAARLVNEQIQLAGRFLTTNWDVDNDGVVTLNVTGQIPVYDDIEAVFARDAVPAGGSYSVVGLESTASPDELREAGTEYPDYVSDRYLALPDTVTERTRDLARSLAAERSSPFDIARAIEREVRGRIAYSLDIDAPPAGQDVVDFVLFGSKIGYCEYHSSAMAVLLRAEGIPSRIAVGYHEVGLDPTSRAYLYKESDAHAWVEAYFPGYGWIPFEPTPSESLRDYGATSDDVPVTPIPTPIATVAPTETPDGGATPDAAVAPTPTAEPPAMSVVQDTDTDGGGWRGWAPFAIVSAAAVAAAGIWMLWSLPYRGLSPGAALLRQVARIGEWLGVRGDPSMTPNDFAEEIGRVAPTARKPARYLAELYAAERYGGHLLSGADERSGHRALRSVRRTLIRSVIRRKRLGDHDRESPTDE